MTPLDAAFHDFADANQGAEGYDCFVGGWEARGAYEGGVTRGLELDDEERERMRVYWQTKVASVEAERDALIQRLASAAELALSERKRVERERDSFRRARDMLAGLLERARVEQSGA